MSNVVVEALQLVFARGGRRDPLVAVDNLDLEVAAGELLAIVGPSGCGKSSLLLAINGLLRPAAGRISIGGQPVQRAGQASAMVFQEFALLPWRTALDNVQLGLELRGLSRAERHAAAHRSLCLVGLADFSDQYPHQLSGGMRQRVALARALATGRDVLLLDEPFGALDAQTRLLMLRHVLHIWERERKTIVLVTHDLDEAIYLADRVVVLSARPAHILDLVRIELPRPRELEVRNSSAFALHRRHIWQLLEREVEASLGWELAGGGRRAD
jgi:ABC-type nitrate/sulfonate/bicarbonate transport system ATPase subunit